MWRISLYSKLQTGTDGCRNLALTHSSMRMIVSLYAFPPSLPSPLPVFLPCRMLWYLYLTAPFFWKNVSFRTHWVTSSAPSFRSKISTTMSPCSFACTMRLKMRQKREWWLRMCRGTSVGEVSLSELSPMLNYSCKFFFSIIELSPTKRVLITVSSPQRKTERVTGRRWGASIRQFMLLYSVYREAT